MAIDNDQLFQALNQFEMWKDGDALTGQRLVQHELVLAHLARLYGSLYWNSQVFGLCPQYPLQLNTQEKTLSKLVAITKTGKLMVCEQANIPECNDHIGNQGLFAIALPYPFPNSQQDMQPTFPLCQVKLEWLAWEKGEHEVVETGMGIPLGRMKEGQWDNQYQPPVVKLVTDKVLQKETVQREQMEKHLSSDIKTLEQNVNSLKDKNHELAKLLGNLKTRQRTWAVSLALLGVFLVGGLVFLHTQAITSLETESSQLKVALENQISGLAKRHDEKLESQSNHLEKLTNQLGKAEEELEKCSQIEEIETDLKTVRSEQTRFSNKLEITTRAHEQLEIAANQVKLNSLHLESQLVNTANSQNFVWLGDGMIISSSNNSTAANFMANSKQAAAYIHQTGKGHGLAINIENQSGEGNALRLDTNSKHAAAYIEQTGKGNGLAIKNQSGEGHALRLYTNSKHAAASIEQTGKGNGLTIENEGKEGHAAYFTANSDKYAALWVEQTGKGNGLAIKNQSGEGHALRLDTNSKHTAAYIKQTGKGNGLAIENEGKEGHAAHFTANSDKYAALWIEQTGKGNGLTIKNQSGEGHALRLDTNSKYAAAYIKQTGGTGLAIKNEGKGHAAKFTANSDKYAALWVEQTGKGDGLIIKNQGGEGNALWLDTNSKHAAAYIKQTGKGHAAQFTANSDEHAALWVEQKGKGMAAYFKGDISTSGSMNFQISHPTKPDFKLVHACVEGSEATVFYRGEAQLVNGHAIITLPDYFEALTRKKERTVQLTPKGTKPNFLSYTDITEGIFHVYGYGNNPNGSFSWEVKAVRADIKPLEVEIERNIE